MKKLSGDVLAKAWGKAMGTDRKQFDMFFDRMLDGFAYHKIIVDKAGKPVDYVFLEVNHAFEKMTGLKREQIIGKKITEVLPGIEKDPADWIGIYGRVALTGEPVQFENYNEMLCKWFKVSAYCPEKAHFVALFEDITERKTTEEKYRRLFEEAMDAIFLADAETGILVDCNNAALKMVGREKSEIVGQPQRSLHPHEETQGNFGQSFKQHLTEREGTVLENQVVTKNGDVVDVAIKANLIDFGGKKILQGIFRDITERKKTEEALKASEEKANDLIKHAPSGIYELDYRIPPKFRRVNDAMCQILGYTREELLQTNPFALLDDESKMRFQERIKKMLAGEKVDETVEFKVMPKDGREIYAIMNTMFTYKDGKPDVAVVIAHDVTERKKAEKELEKRAYNLESLVKERTRALRDSERLAAIGATAGMVGHDIRNPLQAITSDVFLAKSELASTADSEEKKNALESLNEIEKNIDYINKIVQDLQDYARPLNPQPEEVDVKLLIEKLLVKNDLPKNIEVNVKVEDAVRRITADPYYISRIMYNLITNSVQAMPKGGKLTIQTYKEANDVVISVKDTGVGIPEEVQDKMFTAMFTTKSKGQGFGLPVVKRMTESLGGTVTFKSQEGIGTTFTIRVPPKK